MNPIILLHGALGTSDQLKALADHIEDKRPIHLINFEGHGADSIPDRPFRMEYFVENVLDFMDQHAIEKVDFFGYSMGGYAALCFAKEYPDRTGKIATLGTVLKWSREVAERECRFLNPEKIKEKVPKFAEELSRRHPAGWERVTQKTKNFLLDLGENPRISESDWESIQHTVRIHIGDRDETAGIVQSTEVCGWLPKGELTVLPNTPHPIEKADIHLLACSLNYFFKAGS